MRPSRSTKLSRADSNPFMVERSLPAPVAAGCAVLLAAASLCAAVAADILFGGQLIPFLRLCAEAAIRWPALLVMPLLALLLFRRRR